MTSITGKLAGIDRTKYVEIAVPLKYLSNFWRTLDMPLVICKVSLTLTWSENCVITSKAIKEANPAVAGIKNTTNATFKITDKKLYVAVVNLLAGNDNKLLKQLRTGFKRTVKWNKYRSEISN